MPWATSSYRAAMKSYLVILIAFYGVAHANHEYAECEHRDKDEMKEMDREKFEEVHNGYRSLVALGKVYLNNSMSRTASKMMGLKYDCGLENSAYESARKCSNTSRSTDENLYVVEEEYEFGDPGVEAINWWSSEALDFVQTEENLYRSDYNIPNFANLVWDTHDRFGCAIVKCGEGKGTHVVCHYGPKVEKEGQKIYEIGEPCSECPVKENCSNEEGLCRTEP